MKILHVSWSDGGGGAMRAATRLHNYMRWHGLDSRMLVARKMGDDPSISGPATLAGRFWGLARRDIGGLLAKIDNSTGVGVRSYNVLPTGLHRIVNASDADVVNLHWVGGETISVGEIGRIRKPIVWTLRDMWPFGGALHYVDDRTDRRLAPAGSLDLDRWTERRKQKAWRGKPLHIVGLSRWITDCARSSSLFGDLPVTHIPNAIDLNQFRPRDQRLARDVLQLPQDKQLILFGAVGGDADARKGAFYLWQALDMLLEISPKNDRKHLAAVMFGGSSLGGAAPQIPVHCMGRIYDEATLALLHAAADVFVAPSLQENLPNTVIEASACGRPAVGFDVGGISDVISDGVSGRLVPAKDVRGLAEALVDILGNEEKKLQMGAAARRAAEATYAPARIIGLYCDLYAGILSGRAVKEDKDRSSSTSSGGPRSGVRASSQSEFQFKAQRS